MFCLALSSRFFHRLSFTRALILRCRGVDVIPAHCGLCGSFPALDPFDALVSFFLKVDVTLEALSEAHLLLKGISGAYVKHCIECVPPRCFFVSIPFILIPYQTSFIACFCDISHLLLWISGIGHARFGCICLCMGFEMGFSFLNGVMKRHTKPVVHNAYFSFLFVKGMVHSKIKNVSSFIHCFAPHWLPLYRQKRLKQPLNIFSCSTEERKTYTYGNDMRVSKW